MGSHVFSNLQSHKRKNKSKAIVRNDGYVMLRVLSPVMTLDSELFPRDTNKSTFQKGMLSSFCNIIWKRGVFLEGIWTVRW